MTHSNLSRQQLLDGYQRLHANDIRPVPTGVAYHRSHADPLDFQATMNRFAAQEADALVIEAQADAQKKSKSGARRVWLGVILLLAFWASVFLGGAEFALVSLLLVVPSVYLLYKGVNELKLARDDRLFIEAVQSLSNPDETFLGDGQSA